MKKKYTNIWYQIVFGGQIGIFGQWSRKRYVFISNMNLHTNPIPWVTICGKISLTKHTILRQICKEQLAKGTNIEGLSNSQLFIL